MPSVDSYQPGDFITKKLSIKGAAVEAGFLSASIYESIFMPTMVAEFNFRDNDDALFGRLNLSGGEPLDFTFQAPGGEVSAYKFLIHKPADLDPSLAMTSRTFRLICASEEAFTAAGGVSSRGYIQKSYVGKPISYNVQDVLKSYLGTKKPLNLEDTKGNQNIIAENEKVWEFIDRIRRRAVSSDSQSSSYVFFENKDGFNFVTIEKLFSGSVIKTFKQDLTVGTDIMKLTDANIIGIELPQLFSAIDRIDRGTMKSRVSHFNFETNEYPSKDYDTPSAKDKDGGSGSWDNDAFKNKFGRYPGRSSVVPYDNRLPVTNIPESTANQLSYSGNLMQSVIKIRVPGDTKLKAGDLVSADIIRAESTTSNQQLDTDISGKLLIASIRHQINPEGERPRYTCSLECLKGRPK